MYLESVFIKPNNFYINIYNINLSQKLFPCSVQFKNSVKNFFQPNKTKLMKFWSENFLLDALLYVEFFQNFVTKIE